VTIDVVSILSPSVKTDDYTSTVAVDIVAKVEHVQSVDFVKSG